MMANQGNQYMFVVNHQIAGIVFRTEADAQIPGLSLSSRLRRFMVGNVRPDVYIRYRSIAADSLILPALSAREIILLNRCVCYAYEGFDSPLLRSSVVRERLRDCLNHPRQVGIELRHSSIAIFDFARRELDLFYAPELKENLADCRVECSAFSHFLPVFSAVMVHSAGLILNDAAALFLATDEGGKTTVMELAARGTALCDDLNILRREGDTFIVYGTPWGRIIGDPQHRAKIGGFFLLEQARHFELIPLKPAEALEYLWNENLSHRLFLPRDLRIRAFEVIYDACHQAPAYRMRFPKDHIEWDAIDAAMVK